MAAAGGPLWSPRWEVGREKQDKAEALDASVVPEKAEATVISLRWALSSFSWWSI